MFLKTVQSGGGSEEKESNLFLFSSPYTSQVNATDANPFIIRGDFSKVDSLFVSGIYHTSRDASNNQGKYYPVSFGRTITVNHGEGQTSFRRIKVYSDRIEIGQGGYGSSNNDSTYGILTVLALLTTDDIQPII